MDVLVNELLKILPLGQVLGLALLVVLVKMVRDLQRDLGQATASILKLDVWSGQHEKQDEDRFKEIRAQQSALWGKLDRS